MENLACDGARDLALKKQHLILSVDIQYDSVSRDPGIQSRSWWVAFPCRQARPTMRGSCARLPPLPDFGQHYFRHSYFASCPHFWSLLSEPGLVVRRRVSKRWTRQPSPCRALSRNLKGLTASNSSSCEALAPCSTHEPCRRFCWEDFDKVCTPRLDDYSPVGRSKLGLGRPFGGQHIVLFLQLCSDHFLVKLASRRHWDSFPDLK